MEREEGMYCTPVAASHKVLMDLSDSSTETESLKCIYMLKMPL